MLKNYGLMYIVFLLMLLLSDVSVLSQDSLPSIKLIIPKDTPVICTKPYVPVKAIIYGVEDKDDIEVSTQQNVLVVKSKAQESKPDAEEYAGGKDKSKKGKGKGKKDKGR